MPLPRSERIVFKKNPLFAVSAQVRFPTILRIQVDPPAEFQESIRSKFPNYSVINPFALGIPSQVPPEIQAAMRATIQSNLNVNFERAHRFVDDSGDWVVQLSQESVTMSCRTYPRWEVFSQKLRAVWDPFVSIYRPPFATVLGLRYQNAIERSKLELTGVGWAELLKPFIAAEFGCSGLAEADVVSDLHRFEFTEGTDRILVQHGMATNQTTKEPVYSIDNNFNTQGKVELTDVFSRFDQLNRHSGSLFRLCITDRLYNSLDPTSTESGVSTV